MSRKECIILCLCSFIFFFSALTLYFPRGLAFSSPLGEHFWYPVLLQPDEAVNYFFTRAHVTDGVYRVTETLSSFTNNQLHPRSTTVVYGALTPIGFPGFIGILSLFCSMAVFLFGDYFFPYAAIIFIPTLGAIFPWLVYGVAWRLFYSRQAAYYAALLSYTVPAWWYWSARSLQHSVLFVFCLFAGLYMILRAKETKEYKSVCFFVSLFGLFVSVALLVRPNEVLWVLPLFAWCAYHAHLSHSRAWVYILPSVFLVCLFFVSLQIGYYGSVFGTGYVIPSEGGSAGSVFGSSLLHLVLPFGFSVYSMAVTAWKYGIVLFGGWFFLILYSISIVWKEREYRRHIIAGLLCSLFVFSYYGSYYFADNVQGVASIGSSQTRYFLFWFMAAIPAVGYAAYRIFLDNENAKWKKGLFIFLLLFAFAQGSWRLLAPPEGLLSLSRTVDWYYAQRLSVLYQVPENGIVVTRREDKYIFPFRPVIAGLSEVYMADAAAKLAHAGVPVFLYDYMDEAYCKDLKENILPAHNLRTVTPLQCGVWQIIAVQADGDTP